ncbi:isocitrate lyase/phosphoenolpyruvate mutase family protein [Nocardioides sp. C4-1]|uniref:isocitrate lyase/PEP mutase family protein n=1 Tax=Nocardioides sp. C4-1 TaxID=3151851 RepID=UPI003265C9C8
MPESLRRVLAAARGADAGPGTGRALLVPGVGTPLEAHAAAAAGFEAVYVSGYATAAWRHGVPDIGLIAFGEISDALTAVTDVVDLPVVVDADTGYGDVVNVARTVRLLEARGASAVQLEDQTWPKRCGHLRGKSVEPLDVMVRKIAAAASSRVDDETMIIARTDARATDGLEAAIARARAYVEAGADAIFVDAPESEAELAEIAASVAAPLVANMSESGLTPMLPRERFDELGYAIVLYPTSSLRVASRAFARFFADLREHGDSSRWLDDMSSLGELNALVGLAEAEALEARVTEATATEVADD